MTNLSQVSKWYSVIIFILLDIFSVPGEGNFQHSEFEFLFHRNLKSGNSFIIFGIKHYNYLKLSDFFSEQNILEFLVFHAFEWTFFFFNLKIKRS